MARQGEKVMSLSKTYRENGYVKYNKTDFLDYAKGFNYTEDANNNSLGNYKSDAENKKSYENLEIKRLPRILRLCL